VLKSGTTARQVYLPSGTWYDWHTDDVVVGPRYVRAEVTMDRIPIYARGGSVIPMWTAAPPSTAGYQPSAIELHVFVPSVDGTYRSVLQEDDGVTFAANTGARLRTTFELTRAGQQVALRAVVDGNGYADFVRQQFELVIHGAVASTIVVDGTQQPLDGGCLTLPNDGKAFTIEFAAG
jgi:alpha-glucosidase